MQAGFTGRGVTDTPEGRIGLALSAALHLGLVVMAALGVDWLSAREPAPLVVTEVELVDGTQIDAALSSAPVVPSAGPAELSAPAEPEQAAVEVAADEPAIEVPAMPALAPPEARPEREPEVPELRLPPPPTPVPTEAPRPSIALIPMPESLPRQAAEPESPPATEPLQPLAAAPEPSPAPRPAPPPEPEPVLAEEPEPEPETPEAEPEPEAVAEAEPEAPRGPAPLEARLPAAKPAELAAAARASSATEPPPPARAPERTPAEEPEKAAEAEAPARPAGSTPRFAAVITQGEKDALRLGIKRYFVYNGNRADRGLSVTIRIRLGRDARIIGQPELIDARGGSEPVRQALFRAGRRALYKAQNAGEFRKLPPEKYDGWKLIHVTFTPEDIGFAS